MESCKLFLRDVSLEAGQYRMPPTSTPPGLTIMVGISQCPRLIRVKVSVSSNSGAREVGVGQESPFPIKWGAVTMEARSKEDHNVCFLPVTFDLMIWHLFKGQWGHLLPHIKSLANSLPGVQLTHLWGVVVNAGKRVGGSLGQDRATRRAERGVRDHIAQCNLHLNPITLPSGLGVTEQAEL